VRRAGRRLAALRRVLVSGSGLAHGFQSTAAALCLLVVNFANGIITARYLGPTGRGELVVLLLWPQTFAYLAGLDIASALTYQARRAANDAARLYSASCLLCLALGGVAAVVGFFLVPHIIGEAGQSVELEAQLVMLFAPVLLLTLYNVGMMYARLEIGRAGIVAVAPAVVTLIVLVTLVVSNDLTPVAATLAVLVPSAVVTAVVSVRLTVIYGFVVRGLRSTLRSLMSYGLRGYPAEVVGIAAGVIDQAVVAALLGATPVGLYVVALRGSRLLALAANAVAPVLFTRTAGKPLPDVAAAVGRVLRFVTLVSVVGAALLIVFAPQILTFLYGDSFSSASTVLRILSVEIVVSSSAVILTQAFYAVNRPGFVSLLEGASLVVLVGLVAVLIGPYGLTGVAVAVLAASVARLTAVVVSYRRVLGVPVPRALIGRADLTWLRDSLRGERSVQVEPSEKTHTWLGG
jgi:O-antigen/teichoic acid export membrane protein